MSIHRLMISAAFCATLGSPFPAGAENMPEINGCPMFPYDNAWNTPIDTLPVHARSGAWISSIGSAKGFHMDFGSGTWNGGPIGIPYNIANGSTKPYYSFDFYYPDESDPGPYPIPSPYVIEYGSDHHILVADTDSCLLYEVFDASHDSSGWHGGSGAVWSLNSNALRPAGWTSADAAGLPILPGLVRYEEILAGGINHAIRFTAPSTNSYVWPARHLTSGTPDILSNTPPMGARFRLKTDYDISTFSAELQVILQAMKTYGIILADNGSAWFVSGTPDERWDNDMLHDLDVLMGSNFEAVDTSCMMISADSGQADASACSTPECSFTLSSASKTFSKAGGKGSVAVSASPANCNWTAQVNGDVNWITLSSFNYSGNATVKYTVARNRTGASRSGTMTIAGQIFTVNQTQ